ncbi:hypothetical protein ABT160_37220 [Streptomyces sp. NPDC001941]|uniref:hypothetical protein n=1 Tax=Streptomyces sp. NPDC001941 TaxID=3154659 RepID=UPI00331A1725
MTLVQWVPFATACATLLAAGLAGLVAYRAARRTARTTWRAKTAEWQYESVITFYDVVTQLADHPEGPRGEGPGSEAEEVAAAWQRLDLTGPGHLAQAGLKLRNCALKMARLKNLAEEWHRLKEQADDCHRHHLRLLETPPVVSVAGDFERAKTLCESSAAMTEKLHATLYAGKRVVESAEWESLLDAVDRYERHRFPQYPWEYVSPAEEALPRNITRSSIETLRNKGQSPFITERVKTATCDALFEELARFKDTVRSWLDGEKTS